MKRSVDRFLTTHTGSLPRPEDLVRTMFAREEGVPVDAAALAARTRSAVAEIVRKQADAGLDVIDDGELSKPSYATYVKDRLSGFAAPASRSVPRPVDFPELAKRLRRPRAPGGRRPATVRSPCATRRRGRRREPQGGPRVRRGDEGFTAASPGVISSSSGTITTRITSFYAIADARVRRPWSGGLLLQVDCPDLAMGRHTQFAQLDVKGFRDKMELHIEALNRALVNIPADRVRMHLCWGNYPGPHHCDVPLADIIDIVWKAKPHAILFEAANPRHAHEWALFEHVKVPDGKLLIPGVIECQSNYIEHPELVAQRISRYAHLVGRDRDGRTDCGYGTWAGRPPSIPVSCGRGSSLAERAAPSGSSGRSERPWSRALGGWRRHASGCRAGPASHRLTIPR
jgi:5-methyltetrahydropteroyltriglutamate--homocysteine methyltransferase